MMPNCLNLLENQSIMRTSTIPIHYTFKSQNSGEKTFLLISRYQTLYEYAFIAAYTYALRHEKLV